MESNADSTGGKLHYWPRLRLIKLHCEAARIQHRVQPIIAKRSQIPEYEFSVFCECWRPRGLTDGNFDVFISVIVVVDRKLFDVFKAS